jgi:hypothetical protein
MVVSGFDGEQGLLNKTVNVSCKTLPERSSESITMPSLNKLAALPAGRDGGAVDRRLLDVIKDELERRNCADLNPVQALF